MPELMCLTPPHICTAVWIAGPAPLRRAAHIAYGTGLAVADAIILTFLMEAGVQEIYSTDPDLTLYRVGPKVILLR